MAEDTLKIYVWPDGSWESEEEIDDIDWYLSSASKSDDYKEYNIPLELEADDIEELIAINALPGMLPDPVSFEGIIDSNAIAEAGEIKIGEDDIIIVSHSKDVDYNAVTLLDDRVIINAPGMVLKVVKGKK